MALREGEQDGRMALSEGERQAWCERENTTQSWPAGCFDTLSTFDNTHTHTLFHWAKTSGLWSTQITGGNTDTIERIHKSLGMADKAEVTYRIKTNLNAIM